RLPLPGAVLQPAAGGGGGADDRAAEDDDAAAGRRAAGDAAEDDEVHDGLLRPDVLQGGRGAVRVLHRQQRLGLLRAQAAAQGEGAGRRRDVGGRAVPEAAAAGRGAGGGALDGGGGA